MKICCDFCSKFLLPLIAFMFLSFSTQAQSKPNCDLSKCSPKERAQCAKICGLSASNSMASLVNLLFEEDNTTKPNCKPSDCKKVSTTTAKLVSTETVTAPSYGKNVTTEREAVVSTKSKKKCCATSCKKSKVSLK